MNLPAPRLIGLSSLTLSVALVVGAGCEKEDPIRVYSAPKDAATGSPGGSDATDLSAAPPAPDARAIEWTVPQGWEKQPPRQIVFAAFRYSKDDPKAECTVTRLTTNPNLLLQNVNRWEGQLHLPLSQEADLTKLVKDADVPAGKAQVVDLTSPDPAPGGATAGPKQHMIAVMLPHGAETWFLKISGPVALVDAQKANFDAFVHSVSFPAQGSAGGAEASAGGAGTGATTEPTEAPQKLVKWATPAGWKQDEAPRPPRELSFQVGPDDKPAEKAEVAVTRLPGTNADELGQDINMWRGQVGLEPVPANQFNGQGMERVTIGGKPAALFNFAGPRADKPDKRVVVAMVLRGGELWFFKISGPAAVVEAQKPTFIAFVNSAEFAAP